jgi:hypothetical protein
MKLLTNLENRFSNTRQRPNSSDFDPENAHRKPPVILENHTENRLFQKYLPAGKNKNTVADSLRNSQRERSWSSGGWASPCGVQPVGPVLEKSLIGALVSELNSLHNLGLGTDTIHERMENRENDSPARRYLFIGGSHAKKEGNAMVDRGHEVIICAASGWRPNKTAVEEMMVKVEEALLEMTPNDVVVLHLYDNIAYMARSEEGRDLPMRQYINGEFHVEGELVIAGKVRLNTLPLLRMLDVSSLT